MSIFQQCNSSFQFENDQDIQYSRSDPILVYIDIPFWVGESNGTQKYSYAVYGTHIQ